jgi:hypothetical protein
MATFPKAFIDLCVWQVKRAWLKNIKYKVPAPRRRALLLALTAVLEGREFTGDIHNEDNVKEFVKQRLQLMYAAFADCTSFILYFKREWDPKMGTSKNTNSLAQRQAHDM